MRGPGTRSPRSIRGEVGVGDVREALHLPQAPPLAEPPEQRPQFEVLVVGVVGHHGLLVIVIVVLQTRQRA